MSPSGFFDSKRRSSWASLRAAAAAGRFQTVACKMMGRKTCKTASRQRMFCSFRHGFYSAQQSYSRRKSFVATSASTCFNPEAGRRRGRYRLAPPRWIAPPRASVATVSSVLEIRPAIAPFRPIARTLLEQVSSLLGRKRLDELLVRLGRHALQAEQEQIAYQVGRYSWARGPCTPVRSE